jgi:hypothetical protein
MRNDRTTVDPAAEPAPSDTETETVQQAPQPEEQPAADAPAPDTNVPDANASRTGFVARARSGDRCTCPDGRKGTVHKFDSGMVCIPNHDQSE